ncbi:uncharacterized protein LOC112090653 [Morus notabilis]|uniref:uncharacterized protein LOC112090653 n=1 Tax=Morus notabilis TaxID=981085 RepID=UPI000CED512B|nr:uncharacterized protein LOC112090653 [Morus notabilis]
MVNMHLTMRYCPLLMPKPIKLDLMTKHTLATHADNLLGLGRSQIVFLRTVKAKIYSVMMKYTWIQAECFIRVMSYPSLCQVPPSPLIMIVLKKSGMLVTQQAGCVLQIYRQKNLVLKMLLIIVVRHLLRFQD